MKKVSLIAAVMTFAVAVPAVLAATDSASPTPEPSAVATVAPAPAPVPSTGGTDTNGSATTPTTGGSTTNGAATTPSTGGSVTTGATINQTTTSAPSTGGSSTNGSTSNPPVAPVPPTGGSGTNGGTTIPTSPSNNGGSSFGGGAGGAGGYGGVGGLGGGLLSTASSVSSTSTCPLITSYIKLGWNNNPIQVTKLQAFLKDKENLDVTVNGQFDAQTEAAVEAFQKKYLNVVMGPWDATRASGFVYITTTKKINEIACNSPLTLNASELAIINAYKANLAANAPASTAANPDIGMNTTVNANTEVATGTLNVALTGDTSNTAAAGNASIFQRFWNFILSLFR